MVTAAVIQSAATTPGPATPAPAASGPAPVRPRRYRRMPVPIDFACEETVPESKRHLELRTVLYLILKHAFGERACVGCDQFVYWDPTDAGKRVAPDAFVRLGHPDELFDTWKVWERGAPEVAVEIASRSDAPEGPWEEKLARYRQVGVRELVKFDPKQPAEPLRVWEVVQGDLVERVLDSPRSADSVVLGLWWVVVDSAELGPMLRLSRDAEGQDLLPTPLEAEMRAREAETRAREAETRARAEAEARVRALEEELRRRGRE